jgi:hypothetical protein
VDFRGLQGLAARDGHASQAIDQRYRKQTLDLPFESELSLEDHNLKAQ